jgi:hypothetical protein
MKKEMKMKQLLIILSIVVGAFIAACSQESHKIKVGAHQKLTKSVEEMDKATSDEELAKLKASLEKKENLQFGDVVTAVKNKFGRNFNTNVKIKNSDDKEKDITREEKPTRVSNFAGIDMFDIQDSTKIVPLASGENEESKVICIKTCDLQVTVLKKLDATGKVVSVSAFVATEIGQDKITPISSGGLKKVLNSLVASYEVSTDSMNLKFSLTRESTKMIILTENYEYKSESVPALKFKLKDLAHLNEMEDSGSLNITGEGTSRILVFDFNAESARLSAKLKDDLGLFKNTVSDD